jgi:double-stranded uracil-DNA glycosylase
MKRIGFDAVSAKNSRVLIIGTLPGEEALRLSQYYARKTNGFWWIMERLINAPFSMPYEERITRLRQNNLAVWDICKSANRTGSLDLNIEKESIILNDFNSFFKQHTHIDLICFNGRLSHQWYFQMIFPNLDRSFTDIQYKVLPSTSPAHAAMSKEEKLIHWHAVLKDYIEKQVC